jgi:hypothetical protein
VLVPSPDIPLRRIRKSPWKGRPVIAFMIARDLKNQVFGERRRDQDEYHQDEKSTSSQRFPT